MLSANLRGYFLDEPPRGWLRQAPAATRTQIAARCFSLPAPELMENRDALPAVATLNLPFETGNLVDKYRIREVLGTGGFAVVYRATHVLLDVDVALKVLRPDLLENRRDLGALLVEEARLSARIQHPNVARIYDVTHSAETTYVVMELVDGVSLAGRLLLHGALDIYTALGIGLDVARGLAAGLEHGLVHRDIKPANVLLGHDGAARIVDYGMAYQPGQSDWMQIGPRGMVGTRGYMAPEQVRGARVDFRADIYALGVTLEEACYGAPPSSATSGQSEEPAVSGLRGRARSVLPPRIRELLAWMRAGSASRRPQSYAELIGAIEVLRRDLAAHEPTLTSLQLTGG